MQALFENYVKLKIRFKSILHLFISNWSGSPVPPEIMKGFRTVWMSA